MLLRLATQMPNTPHQRGHLNYLKDYYIFLHAFSDLLVIVLYKTSLHISNSEVEPTVVLIQT